MWTSTDTRVRVVIDADGRRAPSTRSCSGAAACACCPRSTAEPRAARRSDPGGAEAPLAEPPDRVHRDGAARPRALADVPSGRARSARGRTRGSNPNARVTCRAATRALASLPIDEALATPLVLPFGDDVTAYARAAHTKALLASPRASPDAPRERRAPARRTAGSRRRARSCPSRSRSRGSRSSAASTARAPSRSGSSSRRSRSAASPSSPRGSPRWPARPPRRGSIRRS